MAEDAELYPELNKQSRILESGKPQIIEEFIDWLLAQHLFLASWQVDEMRYNKAIIVEDARSPEQLMDDFFGIDRDKIEQERMALLAAIRRDSEAPLVEFDPRSTEELTEEQKLAMREAAQRAAQDVRLSREERDAQLMPCSCDGSEYGADCGGANVDCPGFDAEHSCRPTWPAEQAEADDPGVDPEEDESETFVHLEQIREIGTEYPVGYFLHPEPDQRFFQTTGTVTGYPLPQTGKHLDVELDAPLPERLGGRRRLVVYIEDDR